MAKPSTSPDTIKLDFEAVAKHYNVNPRQKRERQVLKALVTEDYVTVLKLVQQNVELVGVAHGTVTSAISRMEKKKLPLTREKKTDSGGTSYTRYYLNRAQVAKDMAAAPA